MKESNFPRRTALVLTALLCSLLTGFSTARAEGYQVSQDLGQTVNYQLSADGKYAVYRVDSQDANYNQSSQLFSVNLATKERKALTPVIGGNGKYLSSYQITPNSQYVVYNASLEADAVYRTELYSIPIAATSQTQRKNIGNVPAGSEIDIYNFYISPDSRYIVYQTNEDVEVGDSSVNYEILFRVAPTGGTPLQLTPRTADGRAENVIFTPDSSRLVYEYNSPATDGNIVFQSVSIGGTGRKNLTDRVYGDAKAITVDSQRFVFTADFSNGGDEVRLYSITLAGSEARKQLSKTGEYVYNFNSANGYAVIVYTFRPIAVDGYYPNSFGFAAADKSYESVSYNTGKSINYNSFAISPDNRSVIYLGGDGSRQLYSLTYQNNNALDQQLSNAAVGQASFNDVSDFKIAPSSGRVVFRATQGTAYTPDLFSVAISNNPVAVKLNNLPSENGASGSDYGVGSYFITPNSGRVVFGYSLTDGSCCGLNLFTNATTGGTPTGPFATKANDDSYGGGFVNITSDARRVVYTKTVYDENGNGSTTLWTALVP